MSCNCRYYKHYDLMGSTGTACYTKNVYAYLVREIRKR